MTQKLNTNPVPFVNILLQYGVKKQVKVSDVPHIFKQKRNPFKILDNLVTVQNVQNVQQI